MGSLASANQQIRDAERQWLEQRLARLAAPHRLTDRLLDHLEELNLDGVRTVPERFETSLADLRRQLVGRPGLTSRLLDRLQTGTRTTELIETVFTIQEVIAPPTLPPEAYPFDEATLIERRRHDRYPCDPQSDAANFAQECSQSHAEPARP